MRREIREGDEREQRWGGETIPVDVEDHGDEFVVTAELPGLTTRDIDLTVHKGRLQIRAERDGPDEGERFLRRERESGSVSRTIRFPEPINERRVSAAYLNGVLRVTVKKSRGRRIPVR